MRVAIDRNWTPARKAGVPYRIFGRKGRIIYIGPLLIVI